MLKKHIIILCLLAVTTGILFAQRDFFTLIGFFFLLFVASCLSILGILIGLSSKSKKLDVKSSYLIIFIFICGISTFIGFIIKTNIRKQRANYIIHKLEEYKNSFKKYPKKLKTIIKPSYSKNYLYDSNTTKENFTLRYSIDGWHYTEYSSISKQWNTSD